MRSQKCNLFIDIHIQMCKKNSKSVIFNFYLQWHNYVKSAGMGRRVGTGLAALNENL